MSKRILAIGGGELKTKETLKIDAYIADEAKKAAGERRAMGLFIPTASHDCFPYYNTFHKVYTGLFDIKTDVVLTVNREFDLNKIREKFQKADFIYVGGGNTVFMIRHWKEVGLLPLIEEAYERGVLITGLSAGAICWFEEMYTDSFVEGDYAMYGGLGLFKGTVSPHYNERAADFDKILIERKGQALGIENDAAVLFEDGRLIGSVLGGGKAYMIDAASGTLQKKEIPCI